MKIDVAALWMRHRRRILAGMYGLAVLGVAAQILVTAPLAPPGAATLAWAAVAPGLLFVIYDWIVRLWAAQGAHILRGVRLLRYRCTRKGTPPMTVTKDTIIADILQNDPLRESVAIFLSCGMHCLGCLAAHGETVEQACAVHGVDADTLIGELNAYFAKLRG